MRLVRFALVALVVLAGVVFGGGMLLPASAHIERSIVIHRSPEHVYAIVNGYSRFNEWSPWAAKDPDATYRYAGPSTGVGASMSWVGDPDTVGSGSQTITAIVPGQRVDSSLDFGQHGEADASIVLAPEAGGTRVTWGFDTDLGGNPAGRWVGLLLERMLAPDYESGLGNLKRVAEAAPDIGDGVQR